MTGSWSLMGATDLRVPFAELLIGSSIFPSIKTPSSMMLLVLAEDAGKDFKSGGSSNVRDGAISRGSSAFESRLGSAGMLGIRCFGRSGFEEFLAALVSLEPVCPDGLLGISMKGSWATPYEQAARQEAINDGRAVLLAIRLNCFRIV